MSIVTRLREHAEEALEGGYSTYPITPKDLIRLLDLADAAERALPVISDMTTAVRLEASGGRVSGEAATVMALRSALAALSQSNPIVPGPSGPDDTMEEEHRDR